MTALPATFLATAMFSAFTTLAVWQVEETTTLTSVLLVVAPLATIWATYAAGHFAGWWL